MNRLPAYVIDANRADIESAPAFPSPCYTGVHSGKPLIIPEQVFGRTRPGFKPTTYREAGRSTTRQKLVDSRKITALADIQRSFFIHNIDSKFIYRSPSTLFPTTELTWGNQVYGWLQRTWLPRIYVCKFSPSLP